MAEVRRAFIAASVPGEITGSISHIRTPLTTQRLRGSNGILIRRNSSPSAQLSGSRNGALSTNGVEFVISICTPAFAGNFCKMGSPLGNQGRFGKRLAAPRRNFQVKPNRFFAAARLCTRPNKAQPGMRRVFRDSRVVSAVWNWLAIELQQGLDSDT